MPLAVCSLEKSNSQFSSSNSSVCGDFLQPGPGNFYDDNASESNSQRANCSRARTDATSSELAELEVLDNVRLWQQELFWRKQRRPFCTTKQGVPHTSCTSQLQRPREDEQVGTAGHYESRWS